MCFLLVKRALSVVIRWMSVDQFILGRGAPERALDSNGCSYAKRKILSAERSECVIRTPCGKGVGAGLAGILRATLY
jgi:hypothetical protein